MTQAVNGVKGQAGRASKAGESASPSGALQASLQQLAGTFTDRAVSSLSDRMGGATDRLTDFAENGGGKGLLSAVTGLDDPSKPVKSMVKKGFGDMGEKVKNAAGSLFGKGKGKGGGKKIKVTNIVEYIDVGASVDLTYRQWTQFADFPKYMKKLEQVEQISDEKLRWKAQIFLSHRSWESTIMEQVPNERIVWRSKGDKGYIDGAITFHELAPNLTRVVVVLEYHPQGLFEKTGNLWRAQGRRVRLELKHFQRQLMTQTLLHPDDVEGWPGEIRDGEVVEGSDEGDDESSDESDESDESDDEDEDDSSSNGQQRRRGAQRRTADRSGSGRKTSRTNSGRTASGTTSGRKATPRKASGRASARKASGTTSSRKSSGSAAARKSSGSSSRTAARTASKRSSSTRAGSSRRRTASK